MEEIVKNTFELPDAELFKNHLEKMNHSIFACFRAIEVLEKEMELDKESKIVLIHVVDMLKDHIQFKKKLQIEGQEFLDKELSKEKGGS